MASLQAKEKQSQVTAKDRARQFKTELYADAGVIFGCLVLLYYNGDVEEHF